jgi:hypothetical protein
MNKKTFVLLTVLAMLALSIVPVSGASAAQVNPFPSQLAYYDAQINVLLPRLESFQAQYHAVNERYYQALISHTAAPDVPTVPDGIEASPTDQDETLAFFWDAYAELPDVLAWSFSIDTYSGPDGDGYVLNVETSIDGVVWMRSINYGPDDWRATDWYHLGTEE